MRQSGHNILFTSYVCGPFRSGKQWITVESKRKRKPNKQTKQSKILICAHNSRVLNQGYSIFIVVLLHCLETVAHYLCKT